MYVADFQPTTRYFTGTLNNASDYRTIGRGRGFDSQPGRYHVTTLGKLFTPMWFCHEAI